jgi:hypothetical protein
MQGLFFSPPQGGVGFPPRPFPPPSAGASACASPRPVPRTRSFCGSWYTRSRVGAVEVARQPVQHADILLETGHQIRRLPAQAVDPSHRREPRAAGTAASRAAGSSLGGVGAPARSQRKGETGPEACIHPSPAEQEQIRERTRAPLVNASTTCVKPNEHPPPHPQKPRTPGARSALYSRQSPKRTRLDRAWLRSHRGITRNPWTLFT